MQRTAQGWLVLTQLTHHNAAAVGVSHGAPVRPASSLAAFHRLSDRRKLLIGTQAVLGTFALGLGILTVAGMGLVVARVRVCVPARQRGAFDAPARQTFVSELVGETDLSNAVALNSTSFNAARIIGPAIAGVLIASVGTGWVFLINAASCLSRCAARCEAGETAYWCVVR